MSRVLSKLACVALVSLIALALTAQPASAVKQFKDQFDAKYVKSDSKDAKDQAFSEAVAAAKCNLCHKGTSKKDRNVYGDALDKLLDRNTDKDDAAKIQAALDKAAAEKSNPADAKSPTFGELISAGKLPGGAPSSEASQ